MSRLIEIVDHRSAWADEFLEVGAALRRELGAAALRINHIGSTSVPGLAAKDVIDVQVTTSTLELSGDVLDAFAGAGFPVRDGFREDHVPRGASPGDGWLKRMAGQRDGARRTHVHIRAAGSPNERYPLLFRDYLRANPAAASTYALIKVELARLHPTDAGAYYAVKDPVCDLIIDTAERWAVAAAWSLPPTDA